MKPPDQTYFIEVTRRDGSLRTYTGEVKVFDGDSILIKEDGAPTGVQKLILLHDAEEVVFVPASVGKEEFVQ